MPAPPEPTYPAALLEELAGVARECSVCYQCGTCTSSCPSGGALERGPRHLVRLLLAGDYETLLMSEDLWRCAECGRCSEVCRMDVDAAAAFARLRRLALAHGIRSRCPERAAAEIATARLRSHPRIDSMRFAAAMAAKGHIPSDLVGGARMGARLARRFAPGGRGPQAHGPGEAGARGPAAAGAPAATVPFYAGCSIPQDKELHALVHESAAGFGVRLAEAPGAGCCGHPSRGSVPSLFASGEDVHTACPACDAGLEEAGVSTTPLWAALTARARRLGIPLAAAAPRFVPYVGCLTDRDAALAALGDAAELAGAEAVLDYPTLHSGCCGALGGMYRGASEAGARLLAFAARHDAPVVTPCVLCRDNIRSAARQLRLGVAVHYWPEFFRAAAPPEESDD